MIQGGLGVAAGGNINPEGVSMFEPMGGSAPKYTGQNVICPIAAVSAVQMLMESLGEDATARRIEGAVERALASGKIESLAAGRMGMSTSEVGDLIAGYASE
jgi:3-isopropylmalate dehydrogenase